jgi:hypothetical protein
MKDSEITDLAIDIQRFVSKWFETKHPDGTIQPMVAILALEGAKQYLMYDHITSYALTATQKANK